MKIAQPKFGVVAPTKELLVEIGASADINSTQVIQL